MSELVLVRHGEAEANAAGLLLGRTNSPLTECGRAQATAVGLALAQLHPVRVVSSPLARARDTAAALGFECDVQIDESWIEIDYGQYEGEKPGNLPSEVWRRWRSDPSYCPPGGESLAQVGHRVRAACEELLRGSGGDVVVVSHVSPIKAAVAWALGAGDDLAWRLRLSVASVTRITLDGPSPILLSYNEQPAVVGK